MTKPYLLVITGKPGSGKTTFAKTLGNEIFMPVISRDQIKEGYVHTFGKSHADLPQDSNGVVSNIFFETIDGLLINNVSIIVEAAFQHNVWAYRLEQLKEKAQIYILICKVEDTIASDRFIKRKMCSHFREYFHGDKGTNMELYNEPSIDVPTFQINTSDGYNPSVKELTKIIFNLTYVI